MYGLLLLLVQHCLSGINCVAGDIDFVVSFLGCLYLLTQPASGLLSSLEQESFYGP